MILLRNRVFSYPRVSSSFLGAELLESGDPEAFGEGLHVCECCEKHHREFRLMWPCLASAKYPLPYLQLLHPQPLPTLPNLQYIPLPPLPSFPPYSSKQALPTRHLLPTTKITFTITPTTSQSLTTRTRILVRQRHTRYPARFRHHPSSES